jgi:hypothetical protein
MILFTGEHAAEMLEFTEEWKTKEEINMCIGSGFPKLYILSFEKRH